MLLINQLLYAAEGGGVREQRGKKERSASLREGGASRKVAWDEKKNKSVCCFNTLDSRLETQLSVLVKKSPMLKVMYKCSGETRSFFVPPEDARRR